MSAEMFYNRGVVCLCLQVAYLSGEERGAQLNPEPRCPTSNPARAGPLVAPLL